MRMPIEGGDPLQLLKAHSRKVEVDVHSHDARDELSLLLLLPEEDVDWNRVRRPAPLAPRG